MTEPMLAALLRIEQKLDRLLAKKHKGPPTPELIIQEMQANPAYAGIDVAREWNKMVAWCGEKWTPTRARFVNWLNRVEAPIVGTNGHPTPAGPSTPAATDAWLEVVAARNRGSSDRVPEFTHPKIQKVVDVIGWKEIYYQEEGHLGRLRAEFLRLYERMYLPTPGGVR